MRTRARAPPLVSGSYPRHVIMPHDRDAAMTRGRCVIQPCACGAGRNLGKVAVYCAVRSGLGLWFYRVQIGRFDGSGVETVEAFSGWFNEKA